jgi:hypothetical protein
MLFFIQVKHQLIKFMFTFLQKIRNLWNFYKIVLTWNIKSQTNSYASQDITDVKYIYV